MSEQATQTAQQPAGSMTEAGFSINVKMLDQHGQEVMLTFRCPFATQSDRLIGHYSATIERLINAGWQVSKAGARGAAPAASGGTALDGVTPICRVHGTGMKPSRKAGSFFCSKKVGDGYCTEKVDA